MDIIKFSISKPVSVAVGVILVVLFGLIGLGRLPVQLTPDVEQPQITVTTMWQGATPYEIEKDIVEEQEEVLKGIQRLVSMESSSFNSRAEITLTFEVGTDVDAALLRVSNKLNEVRRYPENVEKPVIDASGAQSSPVIWMVLKTHGQDDPARVNTYRTMFENDVRQYLERVPGVGSLFVFGGSENQLEIVISAEELARYNLSLTDVAQRLATSNINVSAGILGLDKKNYRVRTVSQYQEIGDPLNVVLRNDGVRRVYLRDVASTRLGYAPIDVSVMHNGTPVIVVGVRKEQGANVIELTRRMHGVIEKLNQTLLKENQLQFEIVYEQTPYINTAIGLVRQNVVIGGILAICVLLIFLRSASSTLTTAIAIPISVIGTFIFMWLMQRSLNVVSLAGISFAVGMLVDNAIVVLENIDRHRNMGKSPFEAAYDGAKEVWGAVLASTTTTVAVFLPIIFMQEESGQLFKDIAIAITFAILLSLVVSVSVIPTMANQLYRLVKKKKQFRRLETVGSAASNLIMSISAWTLKSVRRRVLTIVSLTAVSIVVAWLLIPKAEYLPQGNRNLILNIMIPPPGYSLAKRQAIGDYIFRTTKPYFEEDYKDGVPQIKNMFFVAADRITLFGAISVHETEARSMMPLFTRVINSIPGVFGVSTQAGIFQTRIGRGRTVDINISGEDINHLIDVSRLLFGQVRQTMAGAQVRPVPSLDNSYPEANFYPDRPRLVANGITEEDLGLVIDVMMDGRKVGEYKPEQAKKVDLILRSDAQDIQTPEDIANSSIATRSGKLVRIKDVADLVYDQGMMQIDHLERKRNIKLEVTPPMDLPLQQAMEMIDTQIIGSLRQEGKLEGVVVNVGGNADKLAEALAAIKWNLILAAAIVYLLMSALFENFFYPFFIMFSVPLAAAGGLIGLRLVDNFIAPQPLDIVGMLGFIILIGTVVNNAILIVHQSLNNVRYGNLTGTDAVVASVQTRIRPIFMSTTTSIFGMLPLVLSTGAGSELYRGLGSVILGGLAVSTIFTVFLIPALLSFFIGYERSRIHETNL